MSVFVEPQGRRPLLVMFGAGHVGRAVSALAHDCGFRLMVVDERPDCAVPSLLPGADEIVCAPVAEAFGRLTLDRESFVVIATPGHLHDFDAVRGCLASEAGFIGLLGSRRKRETLLKTLEKEGFDDAQRARVVTPVGLDIGAQTPEEIAVSIVGQLIKIRSGK
jgi:xanthine dehydrogenase accessory factor